MQIFASVFFGVLATLILSASAQAQSRYFCVKPDGQAVCAIDVPQGVRNDPSVLCNTACGQCYLTCAAVGGAAGEARHGAAGLPVVAVTPRMLQGGGMESGYESKEYCDQQYHACAANCRKQPNQKACLAYCESVRSGCGTGNRPGSN